MIQTIAFLSNTITQPFDRFLSAYQTTHYPLDTIMERLYATEETHDLMVILLDISFFKNDYEPTFAQLHNALSHFRTQHKTKIIINTVIEDFYDIYTPLTYKKEQALLTLNASIVSFQETFHDIAILDFYALCKQHGTKNLLNVSNGYLFQTPFTRTALELMAQKIEELIVLFTTPRIKVIALDADNTLWGGIAGEDGLDGIHIDNNYPGIVYRQFQTMLVELYHSGIILILLSKNDEPLVQQVFATKNMPLSLEHFVATAVNWESKSENLSRILQQLQLSTAGVIFCDDSSTEIAEMEQRLGIVCYQMNPKRPLENIETLKNITALKTLRLVDEDIKKTALYKDEKKRLDLASVLRSKEDFIASLNITIRVSCNNINHVERITQLINKTNQFNLTTKRYDLATVETLMQHHHVYDFSVSDTFGDMGLVGVVIIIDNTIDTFLMSCRVLGRGIEEKILSIVTHLHADLKATYIKTEKNSLVENFYENNGFECLEHASVKTYRFQTFAPSNDTIKVTYES